MTDPDLLALHRALLEGDPTAPRELTHSCATRLYPILKRRFGYLPREVVVDAVHDALLVVIARPELYDPGRGSLLNLLVHIGLNKLCDHVRRCRRRVETPVGGTVELAHLEEKYLHEPPAADPEPDLLPPEVEALLAEILPDRKDRQLWELVCQGRAAVDDVAAVLELAHLPPAQRKVEVKRHRDRVVKKVQRRRAEFRAYLI